MDIDELEGWDVVDVLAKINALVAVGDEDQLAELLKELEKNLDANLKIDVCSQALLTAAELGQLQCAGLLIKYEAGVNTQNERGDTALHLAARKRHSNIVGLLLGHSASIGLRDVSGYSPLDVACCENDAESARQMVQYILHHPYMSRGHREKLCYTAMVEAVEGACHDCVRLLIDAGVNVNLNMDPDIGTALHVASASGCLECVNNLLDAGADVENCMRMIYLQTPLNRACECGNLEVAKRLLEAGADINKQTDECSTALISACHFGRKDLVEFLLANGADPHIRNVWGFNALFIAADNPEIVPLLLQHDPKLDDWCGERGEAPLHVASVVGCVKTITMLLEAGADINRRTSVNENIIWLAAWKGNEDVARFALQLNCELNNPSNGCQVYAYDYIPLEIALGNGILCKEPFSIAKMLLKVGCSIRNHFYIAEDEPGPVPEFYWLRIRPEMARYLQDHHAHMFKWVCDFISNPQSLKNLCRLKIRKYLGNSMKLRKDVEQLPLPPLLQSYLLFPDL